MHGMGARCRWVGCLLGVLVAVLPAAEVRMRDGRVLEGAVVEERSDAGTLVLAVTSGRLSAELRLPRADIVHFDPEPSARERELAAIEAEAEALGTGGDAAAWWALAERCRELDPIRFRELAAEVVTLDRHHAEARAALGYRRHNGVWMLAHERAAADGLVYHEGRWIDHATAREVELAARAHERETGSETIRTRVRVRRVTRSAYAYGCALVVPNVWRASYRSLGARGGHLHGPHFVPTAGTRAAGGRAVSGHEFRLAP